MIVIPLGMPLSDDALIVCNGMKDALFLRLALLAEKLGRRVLIVVEDTVEMLEALDMAERLGVRPKLGIRVKPTLRMVYSWVSDDERVVAAQQKDGEEWVTGYEFRYRRRQD